ncbi:hypothetical protein H2200_006947 [Cladophialophora chaetospira]|uniref:BRCT domain-containing protein n=1 Tax=Cladophialophora chaetospira TaxID=386627 RepID=A0AA38X9A8_9EURO|nr:hypothetical protein H2200_006947 [Cladophialophora chaetospira]
MALKFKSEDVSDEVPDDEDGDEATLVQPKVGNYIGTPVPETKLARRTKSKVHRLLKSVDISGDVFTHFVSEHPVNPGLEINGFGLVSLPISRKNVETLSQHLEVTNPGCVQNGYLLLPEEELKFTHPSWAATVAGVHQKLSEALFGHANQALRTPLPNGSVGRALLTLPSMHTGFDLQTSNGKFSETLSLSAEQCFGHLGAFWLQGVVVHTERIEGVFAALIYDILDSETIAQLSSTSITSADRMVSRVSEVRRVLCDWFAAAPEHDNRAKTLVYQLSRFYSNTRLPQLQFSVLDPQDRVLTRFLQHACEGTPYRIYLANVSREIEGYTEDSGYGRRMVAPSTAADSTLTHFSWDAVTMARVVELQGTLVSAKPEFDLSWFVQEDVYSQNRSPDEEVEEYDEEGCFKEDSGIKHIYRDTVVLLAAPQTVVDLLVGDGLPARDDYSRKIRNASADNRNDPDDSDKSVLLTLLCERVVLMRGTVQSDYAWSTSRTKPALLTSAELTAIADALIHTLDSERTQVLLKTIGVIDISSADTLEDLIRIIRALDFSDIIRFIATGVSLKYCQVLLHGFIAQDNNTLAQTQIPHIVESMTSMISLGRCESNAPVIDLVTETTGLEISLANDLLAALISSPDMRASSGIPDACAFQIIEESRLRRNDIDPTRCQSIESFLCTVAINFYLFEVGPPPRTPPSWRRSKCREIDSTEEGMEINNFLSDPDLQEWTSEKSLAWDRHPSLDPVLNTDHCITVDYGKTGVRGSAVQRLNLRKHDRVWSISYSKWATSRQRYQQMLQSLSDRGFLQGPEYALLRLEDLTQMEDRVLGQGPLRGRTFFISGVLPTLTKEQAEDLLWSYGGKLIRDTDINGPDVIGIVGHGACDFERGSLRYWQPSRMSEPELLRWLESLQSHDKTLPLPLSNGSELERKREHDSEPLGENRNLAGSHKRRAAAKKIEITDLCH